MRRQLGSLRLISYVPPRHLLVVLVGAYNDCDTVDDRNPA